MEKEFIPYTEALALKELGFNEPCIAWYYGKDLWMVDQKESEPINYRQNPIRGGNGILAPTFSQAFRWFREKYNLRGFIGFRPNVKQFDYHIYDMSLSGMEYVKQRTMEEYNKDPKVGTYEEAELGCLEELIEIAESLKDKT